MSGSNEVDPTLLEFARQVAAIPKKIPGDESAFPRRATQDTQVVEGAPQPRSSRLAPAMCLSKPTKLKQMPDLDLTVHFNVAGAPQLPQQACNP